HFIRQRITPDTHVADVYVGFAMAVSLRVPQGQRFVIDDISPTGNIHFLVVGPVGIRSHKPFAVTDHAGNRNAVPGRIGQVSAAYLSYIPGIATKVEHPE